MKKYYDYILASKKEGVLYIGVTGDLRRRIYEHKEGLIKGFSKKYNVKKLVYFEEYKDINYAIQREKRMKKWNRAWKTRLIEKFNKDWKDLYYDLY